MNSACLWSSICQEQMTPTTAGNSRNRSEPGSIVTMLKTPLNNNKIKEMMGMRERISIFCTRLASVSGDVSKNY